MKDQESNETLVARFPVVFIVEFKENSRDRLAAEFKFKFKFKFKFY